MKKFFSLLSLVALLAVGILVSPACKKDPVIDDNPPANTGKIKFTFLHHVNGAHVKYDTTMYVNAAGNHYQMNEIKYFISNVTLHKGTQKTVIGASDAIKYVDKDYPYTLNWSVSQGIAKGSYDSISFTLGINQAMNQSFMFVNPPERDMVWPDELGGGYHYMMLNMKWKGNGDTLLGNAFHLGIGQIRDTQGNITGFVHNNFNVSLPNSAFTITTGKTTTIELIMNIENWFQNPNIYDFDYWSGSIMENQDAMAAAAANGHDVFSVGTKITN